MNRKLSTLMMTALGAALFLSTRSCAEARQNVPGDMQNMAAASANSQTLDSLTFGDAASESAHGFDSDSSQPISGGLGQPARILLPKSPPDWEGGSVQFTMKVDPDKQDYLTVRLWGSDSGEDRLILLCEGKQVGYRHLGDVDILDDGGDGPGFGGRFFYQTTPLPVNITHGKSEVHFEIRSNGPVWGYGSTWQQYQKPMTVPTRGIYKVYTHTDGCFVPPASEVQGSAQSNPPTRTSPGPEVMDQVKARVNREISAELSSSKPLDQQRMHLLARAYFVKWTPAYRNQAVVTRELQSLDALFLAYRKNPGLAQSDPAMYNGGWFGLGFAGDVVRLLASAMAPSLDAQIDDGNGGKITRRAAYSEMLVASRDWHCQNRRQYSNQSMITDLNIYTDNGGVAAIEPAHALPDAQVKEYLYESLALKPWLGSEKADGTGPQKPLGDDYWELTPKGLTKELGFVGYYGEVLDWATEIYDATRPTPDKPGDPAIRAQLVRIAHARAFFRYPELDNDGNRAMRAETIVGWRDEGHYPGDITYAERPTWDASPLYAAAATLDPELIGACQQMFADNQFFASVANQLKTSSIRATAGLLGIPDQYELLISQPDSPQRLPMSKGEPDFAWADEEDGVVALKHGNTLLYASLYWRARAGINNLARVHCISPTIDRIAVVHEDEQFTPSGMVFTQPDWTNMDFGNGGLKYPDGMHSAHAGQQYPIAKIPDGIAFKPGDESPYAGRAEFYRLQYGHYLIGMNSTKGKTFTLAVPSGYSSAPDLISGKAVSLTTPVSVAPMSTVILYLGK